MAPPNVGKATALLRAVAFGDADLAARDVNQGRFIQHDPLVADGVAGLREQAGRSSGGGRLEVVRALEDGPLVVVHGRSGSGAEDRVFFAVFRFDGGLIVEQWRFEAPAAPPNESGHTQTDGPTEPGAEQDADRVKAVVRDYYETVHIGARHDQLGRYMSGDVQIRHEPGVRDGVAAFQKDLAVLTRSRTIDEVALFAGQGDLVFVAARGTHEGALCAYVDLYRVEAGRLVEHWGFPQAVPPREASKNGNGLL